MCHIEIHKIKDYRVTLVSQTHIELTNYECNELVKRLKSTNHNENCDDLYRVKIYNNGKRLLFRFLQMELSEIKELIQNIINDISSN